MGNSTSEMEIYLKRFGVNEQLDFTHLEISYKNRSALANESMSSECSSKSARSSADGVNLSNCSTISIGSCSLESIERIALESDDRLLYLVKRNA